jgi:mannose-1-phosphate guanylyltransferase / mannose-6-phosphate isomerase
MLHPVVLCGGSGTRLWPLSRTLLPKQFLPLAGERTMFQDTLLRLKGVSGMAAPIVVSGNDQRFLAAGQLHEADLRTGTHILEPVARNPEATLLLLPADHVILNAPAFHEAIRTAVGLAAKGRLVTFGIVARTPETGYGYIERGATTGVNTFDIARFVEKPDEKRALEFVHSGRFYWNSGMFVFRAQIYLDELARYRPSILQSTQAAWQGATRDLDFVRLDESAFSQCPSESIDYAVMEHTTHASVVAADIGWSDVGSWASLWQVREADANGNVRSGDTLLDDVRDSYIRSEHRLVAAVGVADLVIVETADAVLVAKKDATQRVKDIVDVLKKQQRTEHVSHRRVYRPWGYYESIDTGERFQVKRIMVNPGARLSLQYHRRRAEHWIVVSGNARVTRGDTVFDLAANESTYIPLGEKHRLENSGREPLYLIEVQSGDYLGEDDIVRIEDDFKRG